MVDGVTLNLKQPGKKPHIIINETISDTRKRFTLAHELGHVLIPWHTGMIVDEIDVPDGAANADYSEIEAEANRFAAELLMPTKWTREQVEKDADPLKVSKIISEVANVSLQAASLKLIASLSKGYVFAQIDAGIVILSGKSADTLASNPKVGSTIKPDTLFPFSTQSKSNGYYWWKFEESSEFVPTEDDWRETLDEIIGDIGIPADNIKSTKDKLNGIISYANILVKDKRTSGRVYQACLQRVYSNDSATIRKIANHPKFGTFLSARISSLVK